jgi:hypothetical protein
MATCVEGPATGPEPVEKFIFLPVLIESDNASKYEPQMLFATGSAPIDRMTAMPFRCSAFHLEASDITSAFITYHVRWALDKW